MTEPVQNPLPEDAPETARLDKMRTALLAILVIAAMVLLVAGLVAVGWILLRLLLGLGGAVLDSG